MTIIKTDIVHKLISAGICYLLIYYMHATEIGYQFNIKKIGYELLFKTGILITVYLGIKLRKQ